MSDFNFVKIWAQLVAEKSFCGGWVVQQQNRVTPSPFNFQLWTLDLDLDCDNFTFEKHSEMFSQHYNHIITKSWSWINIKEPFELDYVWRWNVNLADQVCDGSSWVRKCFKRFILPWDWITIFRLEFRDQWTAVVGSCHYLFDLTSEVKISISILKLGALKCFWAARSSQHFVSRFRVSGLEESRE